MDWYTAVIDLQTENGKEVEHILVSSDNGFAGAMEQIIKWAGDELTYVAISELACDYPVLSLDSELVEDIYHYCREHLI